MKAETQTYYQALIDNRDSPFVVSEDVNSGITDRLLDVSHFGFPC